jgi:hypothetical protein
MSTQSFVPRSRISDQWFPSVRGLGRGAKHRVLGSYDLPLSLAPQVAITTKVSLQLWVDVVLMAAFDKQSQQACGHLAAWMHLTKGARLEGYEMLVSRRNFMPLLFRSKPSNTITRDGRLAYP